MRPPMVASASTMVCDRSARDAVARKTVRPDLRSGTGTGAAAVRMRTDMVVRDAAPQHRVTHGRSARRDGPPGRLAGWRQGRAGSTDLAGPRRIAAHRARVP